MKPRFPPRDDRFREVITIYIQRDLLGKVTLTPVCGSIDQAEDIKRALFRSAFYYCSCAKPTCTQRHNNNDGCPDGGQRISAEADVVRDKAGKLRVQVTFRDKQEARRAIIAKYGADPANWPYDPRSKRPGQA